MTGEKATRLVRDLVPSVKVRKGLNEARIEFFMDLYKAGGDVDPQEVYKGTNELRNGLHRLEALKRLGWLDRKVDVIEVSKPRDIERQLAQAYAGNLGTDKKAPLTPTPADTVFVMKQCIDENVSDKRIRDAFAESVGDTYPPSFINKFLRDAHLEITQARMAKATEAVASDKMKVSEAEEHYGLKKGTLGKKITKRSQATTRKDHTAISHALDDFADKKVTAAAVANLFARIDKLDAGRIKSRDKLKAKFAELGGSVGGKRRRKTKHANGKHAPRSRKGGTEQPAAPA